MVLKMMVGNNLNDGQLQKLVQRTMMKADLDKDGYINFQEFEMMVKNLDIHSKLTLTYEWVIKFCKITKNLKFFKNF